MTARGVVVGVLALDVIGNDGNGGGGRGPEVSALATMARRSS